MLPEAIFCRVEDTLISRRATGSLLRCVQEGAGVHEARSVPGERAQAWFDSVVEDGFWQRSVVADVLAAQLAGVPLVVVSDIEAAYLDAIVEACGAEDVLCLTSSSWGQPSSRGQDATSGDDGMQALLDWCRQRDIDPARCRAYSDETGDAFMLDAVGEGIAVVRTPQMRAMAEQRGWSTIEVSEPVEDMAACD